MKRTDRAQALEYRRLLDSGVPDREARARATEAFAAERAGFYPARIECIYALPDAPRRSAR